MIICAVRPPIGMGPYPHPCRVGRTMNQSARQPSRQALSNLVTGKAGVSPEMAIRLSKAFGSTPETWLKMQLAYDLAAAMKHERRIRVRRLPPEYGLIFLLAWLWRLLRRGPLTTAIPRMSAGGLETGNRCPGLGDPPRLLPRHCCQRFF